MLYAFTDESYSLQRYFQVALVVDQAEITDLETIINRAYEFVAAFGISTPIEFHAHSIMTATEGWEPLKNQFEIKLKIFELIFCEIVNLSSILIFKGTRIDSGKGFNEYKLNAHRETSWALLKSIDTYAALNEKSARVMSDKVSKEDRSRLQFEKLIDSGILRNVESISFADSFLTPGIQIADMCVYLYRRLHDHIESNKKTSARVKNLWDVISLISQE